MANVTAHDLGANVWRLEVFLPEQEYKTKAQKDINKYAQRAQVRGFRPGKTPQKLVKTMYGDSFTVESVNKLISETVNKYIEDNKLDLVGEPVAFGEEDNVVFSNKENKDITFSFCVAKQAFLTLTDSDIKLVPRYCMTVTQEKLNEQIKSILKRYGKLEPVTELGLTAEAGETFDAKFIGDNGEVLNETVLAPQDCSETLAETLKTAKTGDTITATLADLDKQSGDVAFVVKNILGKPEDFVAPESIQIELKGIRRQVPANLDEEFLAKISEQSKESLKTEKDFRQFIEKQMRQAHYFEENLLYSEALIDKLVEKYDPNYPEQYLRRLMKVRNPNMDATSLDDFIVNYTAFFKRANVLESLLIHLNINVTRAEVYKTFLNIYNASMGLPPDFEYPQYHEGIFNKAKEGNTADYQHYIDSTKKNKIAQFVFDEDRTDNVFVSDEVFQEKFQEYFKQPVGSELGDTHDHEHDHEHHIEHTHSHNHEIEDTEYVEVP